MVYKTITISLTTGLLLALTASQANAAVSPQCAALETKRQKIHSDLQAKTSPLSQLRIKNTYANTQVPGFLKTKITAAQLKGDTERTAIVKKLRSNAVTTDQKTAVDTYKTEYDTALKTFRAAQDNAQTSYINTYNNLFTAHRTTVDGQIAVLKTKIDVAFNTATIQCVKIGIDKVTPQLKSDISLAQDAYNQTPNVSLASIHPQLQTTAESYKTSSDKAALTFDESMRLSDAKLKTALPTVKYIFE